MKVTVERAALLKSLGHVHRVVERRNTIPILSNVLLRGAAGALHLKATDLDLEITESLGAQIEEPGSTTVPAHVIYDIVRKLAEGAQVSLETQGDGTQMLIRSGRSRFTLQALPESDFPDLAAGDMPHRFSPPPPTSSASSTRPSSPSPPRRRATIQRHYLHTITATAASPARRCLDAIAWPASRRWRRPARAGMPGIIVPRKAVAE
jgi:DNA polymerase-3 subunit beta